MLRSAYCFSNAVVAFIAFAIVQAFPAQSVKLCLLRLAYSESSCTNYTALETSRLAMLN